MICAKCGKSFPVTLKIGDVYHNLQNRKYCLDCSPFKKHNTKNFEKEGVKGSYIGQECQCSTCNKVYKKTENHRLNKVCPSCAVSNRRLTNKDILIKYKGGKCTKCGYNKTTRALTFHHRDPEDKKFTISMKYYFSIETLKKEADKCDLLCANCHSEEHDTRYPKYEEDYCI